MLYFCRIAQQIVVTACIGVLTRSGSVNADALRILKLAAAKQPQLLSPQQSSILQIIAGSPSQGLVNEQLHIHEVQKIFSALTQGIQCSELHLRNTCTERSPENPTEQVKKWIKLIGIRAKCET